MAVAVCRAIDCKTYSKSVVNIEHVKIDIPELKVTLLGRLRNEEDGRCVIEGLISGPKLSHGRELFDCHELIGVSDTVGDFWLSNVNFTRVSIPSNVDAPSTFEMVAYLRFFGHFDPREQTVATIEAEIKSEHPLCSDDPIVDKPNIAANCITRSYPISPDSIVLYEEDDKRISLDRRGTFSTTIQYREIISISFGKRIEVNTADQDLDAVFLLLSILTQTNLSPKVRDYYLEREVPLVYAHRQEVVIASESVPPFQWITDYHDIVPFLRNHLPFWMDEVRTDDRHQLVRNFIHSAERKYIESKFLALCQCFEGLNRLRVENGEPSIQLDEPQIRKLDAAAKEIGLKKNIRSKLKHVLQQATSPALEQRLSRTLGGIGWIESHLTRDRKQRYAEVARRRNLISHGEIDGQVRSQQSFEDIIECIAIVRAACLAEILHLAGVPFGAMSNYLAKDNEVRSILH